MPQLDKLSWLAQIFWLCLVFFSFYFFSVRFVLPTVVSVLKLRSKLNISLQGSFAKFEELRKSFQNKSRELVISSFFFAFFCNG